MGTERIKRGQEPGELIGRYRVRFAPLLAALFSANLITVWSAWIYLSLSMGRYDAWQSVEVLLPNFVRVVLTMDLLAAGILWWQFYIVLTTEGIGGYDALGRYRFIRWNETRSSSSPLYLWFMGVPCIVVKTHEDMYVYINRQIERAPEFRRRVLELAPSNDRIRDAMMRFIAAE